LKATRTGRVPPEPSNYEDRIQIGIRHPLLGLQFRFFLTSELMTVAYDWCGSLSLDPPYFTLRLTPDCAIKASECVNKYAQVILHMHTETEPIPLQDLQANSPTISFKGFGPLIEANDDTLEILAVTRIMPNQIMVDDVER